MSEHRENEFKSLKDKLGSYRVDPPEGVWENIASGIGGGRRRRNAIILLATAASIALAVTLGISFWDFSSPLKEELAENPIQAEGQGAIGESELLSEDNTQESERAEDAYNSENKLKQSRLEKKVDQAIIELSPEILAVNSDPLDDSNPNDNADPDNNSDLFNDSYPLDESEKAIDMEIVLETDTITGEDQVQEEDLSGDKTAETTGGDIALEAYLDSLNEASDLIDEDLTDISTDKEKLKWIIGGMLSPLYSFRDAEGSVMNSSGTGDIESGMIAYAGGVQVGYRPGSRLTIESGILYNKMGINIGDVSGMQNRGQAFDFGPVTSEAMNANIIPVSNSIGNIVSSRGDIFLNSYKDAGFYELNIVDNTDGFENAVILDDVKQNLEYLEIPLNLKYSVIDRTFELQLVGGMSTNFLVNNTVTAQTGSGREEIGYVSNLNSVNYSGNAGIGMIYHFQSNFSLSLEPRFRYYLNSVNDNTLPSTRPYTLGIYTGINIRF